MEVGEENVRYWQELLIVCDLGASQIQEIIVFKAIRYHDTPEASVSRNRFSWLGRGWCQRAVLKKFNGSVQLWGQNGKTKYFSGFSCSDEKEKGKLLFTASRWPTPASVLKVPVSLSVLLV